LCITVPNYVTIDQTIAEQSRFFGTRTRVQFSSVVFGDRVDRVAAGVRVFAVGSVAGQMCVRGQMSRLGGAGVAGRSCNSPASRAAA